MSGGDSGKGGRISVEETTCAAKDRAAHIRGAAAGTGGGAAAGPDRAGGLADDKSIKSNERAVREHGSFVYIIKLV